MLQFTIPLALALAYLGTAARRLKMHRKPDAASMAVSLVILAAHAIWLGVALEPDETRISIAQTLALVGITTAILAVAMSSHPSSRILAGLLLALAGITTGMAAFGNQQPDITESSGWPLIAHILFSVISYTLLGIATFFAVLMAWKDRQVRNGKISGFAMRLPPLQALDGDLFAAIGAGFVTLSLAIFSGLIYIDNIREQHLTHKTVLTFLAWVVFGLLLFGRWRFGWRGQTAVRWTMAGFVLLGLAYFGSRIILEVFLGRQWG
ncbi:MAG: cytochrome c biogenesis protein CcsA [Gammaproteobacteria bacterium]|nr:cytochrome c biogenesis protein CcsA [Gammaproteobacteria bacterium]